MREYNCARARSLVSLWLDDELSELEGVFLDAHLAACSECRELKLSAEVFTTALREAPLDSFHGLVVMPPRGQSRRHGSRLVVAAAAALAAVSLTGVIGLSSSRHTASPAPTAELVRFASESVEERHAKRANLLAQVDRSWLPRGGRRSLLL